MSATSTHPERPRTITDLAAGLTDEALEAVAPALPGTNTVELELCLWQALAGELWRAERAGGVEVRGVIQRAALRTAGRFAPDRRRDDLETAIRPAVAALRLPERD